MFAGRRLEEERSCSAFFERGAPAFASVCFFRFSCLVVAVDYFVE